MEDAVKLPRHDGVPVPAGLISKDQPFLTTQAFLAKLDENLQKAMK